MYKVILSKKYKKSLNKIEKSSRYKISDIDKIIKLISNGEQLDKQYKDHKLKGKFLGLRECHIKPDLLLIYQIENDKLILLLINIGSHSELF